MKTLILACLIATLASSPLVSMSYARDPVPEKAIQKVRITPGSFLF
jgi:hypothetical protein